MAYVSYWGRENERTQRDENQAQAAPAHREHSLAADRYLTALRDWLFELESGTGRILDPRALAWAKQITVATGTGDDGDDARLLLGKYWWYRSKQTRETDERAIALGHFKAYCRTGDIEDIPESAWKPLLKTAVPEALEQHERCLADPTPSELDVVVHLWRNLVTAMESKQTAYAVGLSNLGSALLCRHSVRGLEGDLDESIILLRSANEAAGADHPDMGACSLNLGAALFERFERRFDAVDLDEAIDLFHAAKSRFPAGDRDHTACLSNLGRSLRQRFLHCGSNQDLDESVGMLRQAVADSKRDRLANSGHLADLGRTLHTRFLRDERREDADDAVTALRQSATGLVAENHDADSPRAESPDLAEFDVESLDVEDSQLAHILAQLGEVLRTRSRIVGAPRDLDDAIAAYRQAATVVPAGAGSGPPGPPPDPPGEALYLTLLGMALLDRHRTNGGQADLHEAVRVLRIAVDAAPRHHPVRAECLSNLSAGLCVQARRTGNRLTMDDAVRVARDAVALTSHRHVDRALRLARVADALWTRYERTRMKPDWRELVVAVLAAANNGTAAARVRLSIATSWGYRWADTNPTIAGGLLRNAVAALPFVVSRHMPQRRRREILAGHPRLAADAAALTIEATSRGDDPAWDALRALESGRAVLLGQIMDTREDLSALAETDPSLARRFQELCRAVDFNESADARGMAFIERGATDRRQHLASQLHDVIDEIRRLPGHGSFPAPDLDELATVDGGAIVTLNASAFGCHALILRGGTVSALRLDTDLDAVVARARTFRECLGRFADAIDATRAQREEAAHGTREILTWLWNEVTSPVLARLEYAPHDGGVREDMPRLWWAPGGAFRAFPLHATGDYGSATEPVTSMMDYVVSSYTPTIRQLCYARDRAVSEPVGPLRVVSVAMSHTPAFGPEEPAAGPMPALHHAHAEIAGLRERFRDVGASHIPLLDEDATLSAVEWVLPQCTAAHFACHGIHDSLDPSRSRIC